MNAVEADTEENLVQRIADEYANLTGQEQQAATFIVEHLSDVLVYNSTELAQLSGVSGPTLSRLYRKLGFSDAAAFRAAARKHHHPGSPHNTGLSMPRGSGDLLSRHVFSERQSLSRTFDRVRPETLDTAGNFIRRAEQVTVIGYRNNFPLALHLREQLLQLRPRVAVVPQPGQTLAEELIDLGRHDAAIVIGVRRRTKQLGRILDMLLEREVPIILITDSTARTQFGSVMSLQHVVTIEVDTPTTATLASFTSAFSVLEVLATAVGSSATGDRVGAINQAFQRLHELET